MRLSTSVNLRSSASAEARVGLWFKILYLVEMNQSKGNLDDYTDIETECETETESERSIISHDSVSGRISSARLPFKAKVSTPCSANPFKY